MFSVGYKFRNWKVVEECKSVCNIRSGVCGGRLSVILGVLCVVGEREVELCSIRWPWEGESMVYDWGETKIVGGVVLLPE